MLDHLVQLGRFGLLTVAACLTAHIAVAFGRAGLHEGERNKACLAIACFVVSWFLGGVSLYAFAALIASLVRMVS